MDDEVMNDECPFCGSNNGIVFDSHGYVACIICGFEGVSVKDFKRRPIEKKLRNEIKRLKTRLSYCENGRSMSVSPHTGERILIRNSKDHVVDTARWNEDLKLWYVISERKHFSEDDFDRWWPLPGSEFKSSENGINLQGEKNAKEEIERLQSELEAANNDAIRLAKELEEIYDSPALIAHKKRVEAL